MKNVMSKKVYSPQGFLAAMTGKYYIVDTDDDIEFIHKILRQENVEDDEYPIYDYPLDEIDCIVDAETYVVLVDCMVYNDYTLEYEHEYRWFECGDAFEDGVIDD